MMVKVDKYIIYLFFGMVVTFLRAGETDDDETVCLCIHVGDAKSLLGFINF